MGLDGDPSKLKDDAVEVDNDKVQDAVDKLQEELGRPPTPEEVEAELEDELKTKGTLDVDPLEDEDDNSIMKDLFGMDLPEDAESE